MSNPAPRKQLRDRTIYATRAMPLTSGEPILADLGEAREAEEEQTGLIMPSIYRAPEVMLGMKWDNKVDIWALCQTVRLTVERYGMSINIVLCRHGYCLSRDIFSEIGPLIMTLNTLSALRK